VEGIGMELYWLCRGLRFKKQILTFYYVLNMKMWVFCKYICSEKYSPNYFTDPLYLGVFQIFVLYYVL
jgi:hypothetical protein